MKKLLYILFFLPLLVTAQSQDQNYVKTKVYTKPTTTDVITVDDTLVTIQYSDGLGRPIQTIAARAGGNKQDIISPVVYDPATGKQVRSYLPYADVNQTVSLQNYRSQDTLIINMQHYYLGKHPEEFDPPYASFYPMNMYSETFYEASPLGRVLKQAAPGKSWRGNENNDNDHTIRFGYNTNELYEVPDFTVIFPDGDTEKPELAVNGYYEPWKLIKNTTKDENWTTADGNNKTTQEFTDLNGKTILKRTFNNDEAHDTYYVYDKYDNLTYVIPPLAADQIIVGDEPQVYAGRNYPWTDMAKVDAKLASDYNKDLEMYDNSAILNVDLLDKYGGQGGFSVLPASDGGIVLNLNMTFDEPMELNIGALVDLTEFGQFQNKELGRVEGDDYHFIFYIDKNAIWVDGGGKLPSVNVSLTGDTQLEYTKNIPWTSLCDVSPEVRLDYERDISFLDNSQILSVYTDNDYKAMGGIAVNVDGDNALSLSINITTDPATPLSLQQGMAFPLGIQRRLSDRPLGVIEGNGYQYRFELRDNYIYVQGSGTFVNINYTGVFNEEQPNLEINHNAKEGLCYIYHYDYRNRVVEKKIPGKGWEYMVYDKLNRLIMAKDQNLPRYVWLFTKYDKFNRPVYTGYVKDSESRLEIQTAINNTVNPVLNESRTTTAFTDGGRNIWYTDVAYPQRTPNNTNNFTVLTINYYDDYEFDSISQGSLLPATVYNTPITGATQTLPTGSYTRVLDTDDWILSLNAYDAKARLVYNYTSDYYLDYNQTLKTKLDFTGAVTESETAHSKKVVISQGGSGTTYWENTTIEDYYTYDHMHRLLRHTQKEKNKAHEEMIVYNSYDELGQLVQKKVGGIKATTYTATAGLQTVDYSFNVRGWLTGINDVADNLSTGNDLFAFGINYNATTLSGTEALYNGNIAETHWKTKTDNKLRSYKYAYDALNRLTDAEYNGNYALHNNPAEYENYTEGNIKYDKNGNIERLKRQGLRGADQIGSIDDLVYAYEPYSNKLRSVTDYSYTDGFTDGNTDGDDYAYDANGNMTQDRNKAIADIRYNHLNLPKKIDKGHGKYIDYIYDATGRKLKKIVTDGSSVTTTEYNGAFVYQKTGTGDNNLQFFPTEEGYVTRDANNNFSYIYQYKDHLGNVRLSYTDSDKNNAVTAGEIIEENHYYAYGLKHQGYNTLYNVQNGNSVAQGWKYNGIEYEDVLGMYEMQARHYDPSLARWFGIDFLSENYFDYSPYAYVGNNPLFFADPTGLGWVRYDGETIWDGNVNTAEDATFYYGEESEFLEIGTTYKSKNGNIIILGDNGNFSISGKSYVAVDHSSNTNLLKVLRDMITPDGRGGAYIQYEFRAGLMAETSFSIGIIVMANGEVGIYENWTIGVGVVESLVGSWSAGATTANSLNDFAGWGFNAGAFASAGAGLGVSGAIEVSMLIQTGEQGVNGLSSGYTWGLPFQLGTFGEGIGVYVEGSYTWVQPCVNLVEAFRILNQSRNVESKVQSFNNPGRLKPWEPKL